MGRHHKSIRVLSGDSELRGKKSKAANSRSAEQLLSSSISFCLPFSFLFCSPPAAACRLPHRPSYALASRCNGVLRPIYRRTELLQDGGQVPRPRRVCRHDVSPLPQSPLSSQFQAASNINSGDIQRWSGQLLSGSGADAAQGGGRRSGSLRDRVQHWVRNAAGDGRRRAVSPPRTAFRPLVVFL